MGDNTMSDRYCESASMRLPPAFNQGHIFIHSMTPACRLCIWEITLQPSTTACDDPNMISYSVWLTLGTRYEKCACSEARSLPRLSCMQMPKMVSATSSWLVEACSLNRTSSSPVYMHIRDVSVAFFLFRHCMISLTYLYLSPF
jgi:hypothetical protein